MCLSIILLDEDVLPFAQVFLSFFCSKDLLFVWVIVGRVGWDAVSKLATKQHLPQTYIDVVQWCIKTAVW